MGVQSLSSIKAEHSANLQSVGVSGNVVIRLSEVIPKNQFHKLYFDNWFTSLQLAVELAKVGIL